jgi:hypothetical protein
MGIRFLCPNGHRLNVKSFLAGKRGICPHCNARFDIPFESVATAPPPPRVQAQAGASTRERMSDRPEGVTERPASVTPSVAPSTAEAPMPSPIVAEAKSIAGAASTNGPAGFPVQPATEAPTPAPNPAAPASSAATPDPIAEAPTAVWYVRTNAGGKFGPARGDMMQQWLDERRVGPDYLVWREGWPEWRRASAVFARFAGAPGLPSSPAAPVAPAPAADDWVEAIIESQSHPASMPRVRPKRPQNNNLILAISFAVVILGAILVVVVIIAATKKSGDDNTSGGAPSTSTSTTLLQQEFPLVASNHTSPAVECRPVAFKSSMGGNRENGG